MKTIWLVDSSDGALLTELFKCEPSFRSYRIVVAAPPPVRIRALGGILVMSVSFRVDIPSGGSVILHSQPPRCVTVPHRLHLTGNDKY